MQHRPATATAPRRLGAMSPKLIAAVVGVVVGGGVLVYAIANSGLFGDGEMVDAARKRVAIDSVSGEVFHDFAVRDGDSLPWRNPRTGQNTLYPAERCFWTADGKAKTEPTYVYVDTSPGGPGFATCPDCGRRVVPHNPMPPDQLLIEAAANSGG